MNERIRKLVEKAPYTTISTEGRLFTQQDLAKFAELIVRECLAKIYCNENGPAYEAAGRIKEHFGVKE